MNEQLQTTQRVADPGLVQYVNWIYGLHGLSICIGLLTSASIAGKFVFGLPSIIAVIMNYVRRSEAQGTFLESHFHWQIRTFWFALLWLMFTVVVSIPLLLVLLVGIIPLWLGFALIGVWVIYRVARGWMALRNGLPVTSIVGKSANGVAS
jgi:uncharacterized membrane protein